ncbi:protein kinase [candidate division KSB1 bacterium]|nr:protein kinase [candidate division KSB1 bacterium]
MTGKTISHYSIVEKLGEGGMGVVYKAEDLRLGRFVVLKFLAPHLTRDAHALERFINEAKTASSLDHPNICTIYEIGETEDERVFIAMAYYEGETLAQQVAKGNLQLERAIEIAAQIGNGLACAHEAGITHRDIKPANVMITKRGEVKLLDFGLAKLAGQSHFTKTGATLGTVAYMSPEQAQGLRVDLRTDIWSLGVVLYEMLAGKLPFESEYDQAVLYAIVHVDHVPLAKLRPELPAHLSDVIDKALAKKAEARYQRIEDLLTDLQKPVAKKAPVRNFTKLSKLRKVPSLKRFVWMSGILVLLTVLFFGVQYWLTPQQPRFNSIAVLPLQNLSGDPEQEYFADGMTEALIANLAKIKSLRVISRTSIMTYKNARKPLPEIAKALNVEAVVEGSVALAEGRVRVTAQLIDAVSDRHLWVENYDRNLRDVLALQSEVTEAIVSELRMQLTPQEQQQVTNVRPVDPEAYQHYLKGREYFNNIAFEKGVESFQQAILLDPAFASAYAGLATCYIWSRLAGPGGGPQPKEVYPRAKAATLKALSLDKNLGEAYAALAMVKFLYEWEWDSPDQDFKRALSLEPQSPTILVCYSLYLRIAGSFDEGMSLLQKAIALDPLSPSYSMLLGRTYGLSRRYDESIAKVQPLLEVYPNHWAAIYQMAWNYYFKDMHKEALAYADRGPELTQRIYIYARTGRPEDALKLLDELHERMKHQYYDAFAVALAYTGLGDYNKAFEWLDRAYQERATDLVLLNIEPALDPIRSDPRYAELCRKMGLEE